MVRLELMKRRKKRKKRKTSSNSNIADLTDSRHKGEVRRGKGEGSMRDSSRVDSPVASHPCMRQKQDRDRERRDTRRLAAALVRAADCRVDASKPMVDE
jgi:hypothetical protein